MENMIDDFYPYKIHTSMNETIKRYAISAGVSFLTGFAIILVSQIDTLSLESFKDGTALGVLFLAARTGIKGVLELFIATYSRK